MKGKGDLLFNALPSDVEYPVVIANPRVGARFTANRHLPDTGIEIGLQINRAQKRGHNNGSVSNGKIEKEGKPIVGQRLVLDGAADYHMQKRCLLQYR